MKELSPHLPLQKGMSFIKTKIARETELVVDAFKKQDYASQAEWFGAEDCYFSQGYYCYGILVFSLNYVLMFFDEN